MPKDPRLYANITHDFADSPKIVVLSVEARWALIEMILWCCRMQTDGRVSKAVAGAKWSLAVCQELATNDPENPSLVEDENGDFWVHDFAEHQTTKAEIEAIREKKRAAGRLGGKAKKANQPASSSKRVAGAKANAKQVPSSRPSKRVAEAKQNQSISKKKEGGEETAETSLTEATESAQTPHPNLDELSAAHAAQPTPGVCPRHPDGNPDGEPCWQCKTAKDERTHAADAEKRARRADIDACQWCDERGIYAEGSMSIRCDHGHQPPTIHQPTPQERQELDTALLARIQAQTPKPTTGPY